MIIDLDDIHLYLDCPIKHKMYRNGIKLDTLNEEFSRKLHKVISYFYYSLMNDKNVTAEQLKQKWGMLWSTKMSPDEIMFRERNERTDLEYKGVSMLINFRRSVASSAPIAVEQKYSIPCGEHELTGSIELIREVEGQGGARVIEIVDFKTGDQVPDAFTLAHDINLTAQSYAFRRLYGVNEDRIVYHHLKTNKPYFASRDNTEFRRMINIVNAVGNAIEREEYYPKYSQRCKSCRLQHECEKA